MKIENDLAILPSHDIVRSMKISSVRYRLQVETHIQLRSRVLTILLYNYYMVCALFSHTHHVTLFSCDVMSL